MIKKLIIITTLLTLCTIAIVSCTKEVSSRPHFIFKPAPSEGAVAQFMGQQIAARELYRGVEQDLYEAQMAVYNIKLAKLKSYILEKLVTRDAKEVGLSHDQFLNQVIAKGIKVESGAIEAFIKERNIPKEKLNDTLKKQIERFLIQKEKKIAIERWLAKKTAKNPVEVYLSKPLRPVFDVSLVGAPYMGGKNAKVVVAEFSDFQCQYCRKGAEILKKMRKKYGDKIKIVFKNFPLSFHNDAEKAAMAGLCARDQGQTFFWKMHDKMFENQGNLDKKNLTSMAEKIGLKMQDFVACMESQKYKGKIRESVEEGKRLGVKSTPTFFVNGQVVVGVNEEEISQLINEELKK